MAIQTANGPIELDALGQTLMHEHLVMAMAGWESDTSAPVRKMDDLVQICVDRIEELKDGGFSSLLDPCPMDIGRDAELYGEVSARTGFNIIFSTGIYNEHLGGAYWLYKVMADPQGAENLAALYVNELTDGVGPSRLKPAIIKLAIGKDPDSAFEGRLIKAAAMASLETGAPSGIAADRRIRPIIAGSSMAGRISALTASVWKLSKATRCGSRACTVF